MPIRWQEGRSSCNAGNYEIWRKAGANIRVMIPNVLAGRATIRGLRIFVAWP